MDSGSGLKPNHQWDGTCTENEFSPLSPTSTLGTTTTDGPKDDPEHDELRQPLCSVLNTVIDYVMKPPTALELEDLLDLEKHQPSNSPCNGHESVHEQNVTTHEDRQHTMQSLLVPVIRVFGPILRRQNLPAVHPPVQSACLHIHGAFPYLLARPRLAGPDGSLHQNVNGSSISVHLDWDDPIAVERLLPILKTSLEDSIQASSQASWSGKSTSGAPENGSSSKKNHQPKIPIIRRLSVVMGRGFYTYCPGPPAPFVRVEYYNPSNRWKVKRALEKGLDALPLFYHPDPIQYDPFGRTPQRPKFLSPIQEYEMDTEASEALQFHCYEAHIPYTMQFFKDWNLAGMSYIHVGPQALFRQPLPESRRDCCRHDPNKESCGDVGSSDVPNDYLFLSSNTESQLLWPEVQKLSKCPMDEVDPPNSLFHGTIKPQSAVNTKHQSHSTGDDSKSKPLGRAEHVPLEKDTSCDIELDISVDSILNVFDVMKGLPDDDEERKRIHWRAVPSLRELWKQERLRMSKLLAPENDFLSNTQKASAPPFTLSVKGKDTPIPGTRLAVEGMRRLLNVTEGLEESFRRATKQVIERYSDKVDWIDQRMRCHTTSTSSGSQQVLTPTFEETVSALSGMGAIMENVENDKNGCESCNSQELSQGPSPTARSTAKFLESTELYYNPSKRSALRQDPADDFLLSQLVEQGESIVQGPFGHADDFIDPETLRPFETIDDGDSIFDGDLNDGDLNDDQLSQDELLEKELSTMATQTLELGTEANVANTDRAGSPKDTEELDEEDAMGPLSIDEIAADSPALRQNSCADAGDNSPTKPIELFIDHSDAESAKQHLPPPPVRKDVTLTAISTRLLPLPPKKQTPDWMQHLAKYTTSKRMWSHGKLSYDWFSGGGDQGGHLSLTRCPPSHGNVVSWLSKQTKKRKTEALDSTKDTKKIRVNIGVVGTKNTDNLAALVVDGNSRKLVVEKQDSTTECDVDDKIYGKQVEEVAWCPSQQMSQVDTPEAGGRKAEMRNGTSETKPSSASLEIRSDELSSSISRTTPLSLAQSGDALDGIGQQGGKLWVENGGRLKAETNPTKSSDCGYLPTPLTVMSIEVHVQCRTGRAGVNDSKQISMVPDSEKDPVCAVVFVFAKDPGGGESLEFIERGVIFVPNAIEFNHSDKLVRRAKLGATLKRALPRQAMGISSPVTVDCVGDERSLLFRMAAKVQARDPDMLISWDTQGLGIGYLVERGAALSRSSRDGEVKTDIDIVNLMGRCRRKSEKFPPSGLSDAFQGRSSGDSPSKQNQWKGSGLGSDWDERVGAGAAAASISGRLVFAAWKIVAEEVKHANFSYQPAVVAAVLGCRIPFHGDLRLTQWYGHDLGKQRWRVIHHRLVQAMASLLLFDALDIIGRAGEAARLSGVEFSQSFPGIRGSQYKVEGVLLRALQSLNSAERGSKKGKRGKTNLGNSAGDGPFSLSDSTKSQTQSPWKARREAATRASYQPDPTKPLHDLNDRGYFFFSPSLQDADRQEALEVQALTLEPESAHYEDPIVVCDFTALYPSLVIAYNLCYSTCAGRLEYHSTRQEMRTEGRTTGKLGPFAYPEGKTATTLKHHMKSLGGAQDEGSNRMDVIPDRKTGTSPTNPTKSRSAQEDRNDRMYVVPTGTMYVSESVVKGVLPQVLDEMLSTRAMLKKAAKEYKRLVPNLSPSILRQLEARQLALKYVANVTYGYTSATFSGRCAMPLLADTIVECGRRTLKNAINLANSWGLDSNNKWAGCKVLYGDTDSVFIRLPGRSVEEAFRFGEEFCHAVTANNPPPVQLKLEKVYLGSILQTKKKYCGMKYESTKQPKPMFEAKGIETIRRDQCALTQKILRNSLITLFSQGIAAVRRYLIRQWTLILSGELPVSDFIFTGRVRSRYRGTGMGPVQAVLARRLAEADPGRVMRHKERIAFVIVATPGRNFRLRDGVLTPNELLEQWDAYVLNTTYYITKHVNPSLQRCLGLAPHHIDVTSWYTAMAKPRRRIHFWPTTITGSVGTLSRYFANSICVLCGGKGTVQGASKVAVCEECQADELAAIVSAFHRLNTAQTEAHSLAQHCARCHLGFEDADTYATVRPTRKKKQSSVIKNTTNNNASHSYPGVYTPLASCSCIDCPITFKRHRARESEFEALELCKALGADAW